MCKTCNTNSNLIGWVKEVAYSRKRFQMSPWRRTGSGPRRTPASGQILVPGLDLRTARHSRTVLCGSERSLTRQVQDVTRQGIQVGANPWWSVTDTDTSRERFFFFYPFLHQYLVERETSTPVSDGGPKYSGKRVRTIHRIRRRSLGGRGLWYLGDAKVWLFDQTKQNNVL